MIRALVQKFLALFRRKPAPVPFTFGAPSTPSFGNGLPPFTLSPDAKQKLGDGTWKI